MKNITKIIFCILFMLAISSTSHGAGVVIPANYKTVALVLSSDNDPVNTPSVELYRAVLKTIEMSGIWPLAPLWPVKKNLSSGNQSTGAIPSFERQHLLNAHPKAKNANPGMPAEKSENKVIEPVQIMLDTLAIEGAIIVDCVPSGPRIVRGCGLYYYDRSRGKVVASARKYYRAGVMDASNWADHFTVSLAKGMRAAKEAKDKKRLDEALTITNEIEPENDITLELQTWGQSTSNSDTLSNSVPGATLIFSSQGETYGMGLDLSYGRSLDSSGVNKTNYMERSASLHFTAQAKTMKSLVWDLGLGLGAAQRSIEQEEDSGILSAKTTDFKLGMAPGIMWELNPSFSFGLNGSYEKYFAINKEIDPGSNANLFDSAWKIALRLKTTF
jgi:hypothetical protein